MQIDSQLLPFINAKSEAESQAALEQSKVEEIALAKRSAAKSHLVMGLVYAEAGLLNEAEKEFDALLKANPDSSTARKLFNE